MAAVGALGAVPRRARAADPIPVDGCTTITTSGTYALTQDLQSEGTCIRIRQNNVTLDGQGHTIQSSDVQAHRGHGIDIRPRLGGQLSNVAVRNVAIRGFRNGIAVQDTRASDIRRVTATENNLGFFVNGTEMTLDANTARLNADSGIVTRGDRNSVTRNTVDQNRLRGIYVRDFSYGARVLGNTVTGHQSEYGEVGSPGIVLKGGSGSHLVATNELGGNRVGILLESAPDNTIRRNLSIEHRTSADIAIRLEALSDGNLIDHNTFERGIQVSNSDENEIARNSLESVDITDSEENAVSDNDVFGVALTDSPRTVLVGNRITGSDFRQGVSVNRSADTAVRGNAIADAGVGVALQDSERTRVRFNGVESNGVGVRLTGSGATTATIGGNNFLANARYGVENETPEVVDARFNYWGAGSGPSSPADPDSPLADPVTGELADGTGDAVSESPERAGVSNVRFDPWNRRENPLITLPPIDPPLPIDPPAPIDPPIFPFDR